MPVSHFLQVSILFLQQLQRLNIIPLEHLDRSSVFYGTKATEENAGMKRDLREQLNTNFPRQ